MLSGTPSPSPASAPSPSPPLPPPIPSHHSPTSLLRLKRAHTSGHCDPSTPVPSWKLYENPFYENSTAMSAAHQTSTVSARKLAASLWELQEMPISSRGPLKHAAPPFLFRQDVCSPVGPTSISTEVSPCSHLQQRPSPTSMSDSPQAIKRSFVHPSFKIDAAKHIVGPMDKLKLEQGGAISSPHELLKVLNRLRSLEEQQSASVSLVTALRMELEHAQARVQELEFAQTSARKEIDNMLKKVDEERTVLRTKEQEKFKAAIDSLREDIEEEKKARRKLGAINRRLARSLSESNKALAKAVDEIERERKGRELMEDVCAELAKEIGKDKAEIEQVKRDHATARKELDEERKMLQMAEVWREERVQMKLAEARLELEKKNMALDKLRNELELFLNICKTSDIKDDPVAEGEIREAEMLLHQVQKSTFLDPELDGLSIDSDNEHANGRCGFNSEGESELDENSEIGRIRQWSNQRYSLGNGWHPTAIKLRESKAPGLDRLEENQLDEVSYADDKKCAEEAGSSGVDGCSEGEHTSKGSSAGEKDGNADSDENGAQQDESSPWNSETEMEESEDGADLSLDFNGGYYGKRYNPGSLRMGFNTGESLKKLPNKEGKYAIQDSQIGEIRPVGASLPLSSSYSSSSSSCSSSSASPIQKSSTGLGSPRLKFQQGAPDLEIPHVTGDMKGLVEWPRGFRRKSLQAKLLEARMESQKHLAKLKSKK